MASRGSRRNWAGGVAARSRVVRTGSYAPNRHDTGSTTARSGDEIALIRDTINHYGPVFIAPLSIRIRRAGVQKKFVCIRCCRAGRRYSRTFASPSAGILIKTSEPRRRRGTALETLGRKEPRRMNGAKFGRSIVMGLPGRWQTQHSTPTRSVGFCVQSPTQHRLHTARIKKAPPAGGAKGLILMHR